MNGPVAAAPRALLLPVFALAVFTGSLLLFGVQPMATRMVLPTLGGSPAVWNTGQVFFQLALLGGYLYSHLLTHGLAWRRQLQVHAALLLAALMLLPVALAGVAPPAAGTPPGPWLVGVLALHVGLPFVAVATTAPLVQRWFAHTPHHGASDPYFLYSASNLGGLLALLGYPFLVDPLLGLEAQSRAWTMGYLLLVVLLLVCGWLARGLPSGTSTGVAAAPVEDGRLRARWMLLAFAPAALMLGVTLHVSTDVGATPFLWVLPLALYLLSFVVAFARRPRPGHDTVLRLLPFAVALLLVFFDTRRLLPGLLLHLGVFFVVALACHGELARLRPPVSGLTRFYLWLSLGGVLGGTFSGLLAPLLFEAVLEYPMALVLAAALVPGATGAARVRPFMDVTLPLLVLLAWLLAERLAADAGGAAATAAAWATALALGAVLYAMRGRRLRFALCVALVTLAGRVDPLQPPLAQARSFFGVHRVLATDFGRYHVLVHGNTVHGAQAMQGPALREPLTYYTRAGPAGQVTSTLAKRAPRASIGVVGMGTGAFTCLAAPGQRLYYVEIDPEVVRIASDPALFRFLSDCGRAFEVEIGDGRAVLAGSARRFDLLVIDAFSSDAVPVHLLTREALALYARRLAPGGMLLLHLSNRHFDLAPVVGALAADAGLAGRLQDHRPAGEGAAEAFRWRSRWVLLAPDEAGLAPFVAGDAWLPLPAPVGVRPWTDDYADLAGAVRWDTLW